MDSQSDSRKRPLDSDGDDANTKRSNQGHMGKALKWICVANELMN